jgi:hypothetical protein
MDNINPASPVFFLLEEAGRGLILFIMKKIITLLGLVCLALPPIAAQTGVHKITCLERAKAKVADIGQIIVLYPGQQRKLQDAYVIYSLSCDSIATDQQKDKSAKEKWERKVNRRWQATLMGTFDDKQRMDYLTTITKPQVDSLVASNMSVLQQSGLYTKADLQKMKKSLVDYHTQELIIQERDRYDIASKQENLIWLRTQRPKAYKLCQYIQSLQQAGVLKEGKIVW